MSVAKKFFVIIFFFAQACMGQILNGGPNETPAPTAYGHFLLGTLSALVNPADGSLTVSLPVPVPKGRGPYVPFAFRYSSNEVNHLEPIGPTYICT